MSEWISVKERLPEHEQHVLIYHPEYKEIYYSEYIEPRDYAPFVDYPLFFIGYDPACNRSGAFYREKITHWMPLPEPPK